MKLVSNLLGRIYLVYALLLFIATMFIVWIPIWIISRLPEPRKGRLLHPVLRGWMGVYLPLVFCPVRRKGTEHFRTGEQYVVVINHNSLMDIPVSTPWIPGPNKTLAKIEMAHIPVFGLIYRAGSILVDRKKEASRRESFAAMQATLDMGLHLCLYPEGTRNKTGKPLQPFYDGAFITAIKAQKPLLPGIIVNTGKILPHDKKFWARPMPIYITFLEPIPTIGLTLDDLTVVKDKTHQVMESFYMGQLQKK